ncbi:PTS system, mannose-specific IIC component [Smithella sp. ME-1]|uniref:Pts system, mannose-specific iic component n=1 Tax=hydrocarbon metagenome TaxID=938273 RepID=A0A0W8FN92_9ZZZZ|nr:PTS system, mannose-specific IIC component [Smithella sp. ME-1]
MFTEIILVSLLGGLLCLDRVFIQAMVSRPVVIAPLIGLLLNNPYAGLIIGAFVELIWIDRIPIGTYIPPNDSITAVVATSTALIAGSTLGGTSPELISLSILIAIPCGGLAKQMDVQIIKSNDSLSDKALEDAKENNIQAVERKTYLGLIKVFLFYVLFLLAAQALLVPSVIWIYPQLNATAIKTLSFTYYFLPLLGIAVAINMLKLRRAIPVFCAIFLIVALFLEVFHIL